MTQGPQYHAASGTPPTSRPDQPYPGGYPGQAQGGQHHGQSYPGQQYGQSHPGPSAYGGHAGYSGHGGHGGYGWAGQRPWRPPIAGAVIAILGGVAGLGQLWLPWLQGLRQSATGSDVAQNLQYAGRAFGASGDSLTQDVLDWIGKGIISAAVLGGLVILLALVGWATRRTTAIAPAILVLVALLQIGIGIGLVAALGYYRNEYPALAQLDYGIGLYLAAGAGVPTLIGAIAMLAKGRDPHVWR